MMPPPHTVPVLLYKNLVKNWNNGLIPSCDSEGNFSAASRVFGFEGGGDERGFGFGGFIFFGYERPTQP